MTTARNRPAYALVELLVVLTVVAVLLTLCAGMLHLLMKLDRSGRTASDESADLARLARDFRADAHSSSTVDPGGRSTERLTLPMDGGRTVEYQVRPRDVLRTIREGEKVRRFETYRRPARTSVRLDVEKVGARSFATLLVDRPPDGRDDAFYRDLRVEAELGRDLRLNPRAE
jgi:hypothetical protein